MGDKEDALGKQDLAAFLHVLRKAQHIVYCAVGEYERGSKKCGCTHTWPARLCPNTLWLTGARRLEACSREYSPHLHRLFQPFRILDSNRPEISNESPSISHATGNRAIGIEAEYSQKSIHGRTQTTFGIWSSPHRMMQYKAYVAFIDAQSKCCRTDSCMRDFG